MYVGRRHYMGAERREGAGVRKRKLQKRKQLLKQRRKERLVSLPSFAPTTNVSSPASTSASAVKARKRKQDRKTITIRNDDASAPGVAALPVPQTEAVVSASAASASAAPAAAASASAASAAAALSATVTARITAFSSSSAAESSTTAPFSLPCAAQPRALPTFSPPPWELRYDVDGIETQLRALLGEPVLGVDIEWRPTFVSGAPPNRVALVQLSSRTRCVLVPVRHLPRLPPSLSTLLGDARVWKVGCGVAEDARKLLADCGLACAPTLEIGAVGKRLQAAEGLAFPALPPDEAVRPGLAGLCRACGQELAKPKSVTRSNWERRPLTPQQQRYAALDAYSSLWIATCIHALHARAGGRAGLTSWCLEQSERLTALTGRSNDRPIDPAHATPLGSPSGVHASADSGTGTARNRLRAQRRKRRRKGESGETS